jgi:regulatory subunit for Cdc7p protein kinase
MLTIDRNDILFKAQEMSIKIWSVEKLQRILEALYHAEPVINQREHRHVHARGTKEAELSQMLQNERRQAAQDRDWMTEMVPFKGYYVYVHDMDERTKPVMIRDYPRVLSKELGKWPQLRVAQPGRCPFVEDPPMRSTTAPARRVAEQPKPRTRAVTLAVSNRTNRSRPLEELPNPPVDAPKPLDAPDNSHVRRGSTDHLPAYGTAQASLRGTARMTFQRFGHRFVQAEPVASGIQPSNITSAVRSQVVSSAAVAPGGKAGSTRELNALKRNLITEKNLTHMRAVVNADESKPMKRKILPHIAEEEGDQRRSQPRKKRVIEKEPKSGYCENCREKFDDFDEVGLCRLLPLLQTYFVTARRFSAASQVCTGY